MWMTIQRSALVTVLLALILCGIYPLAVTVVAKGLFPDHSSGSLIVRNGVVIGSRLLGQKFTKPGYFHGRPSSAGDGYDAANSSGSNLGPTSKKLVDTVKENVATFLKENPGVPRGDVPVDIVTASGSGLDPHVSPEAAFAQVARVAGARKIDPILVRKLVEERIEGRWVHFLGERRVNILELNLALDEHFPDGRI